MGKSNFNAVLGSVVRRWWHAGLLVCAMIATSAMAQPRAVPTVVVQAGSQAATYQLDGVVQAVKQSTVAAQAAGRIASLNVKAGDHVRAGQLLASIDDREAGVAVQRSQAQINQADADLRNARAQLERTRDLQTKGFVSKAALDTVDAQYQSALAQRDQADAAARQSGIAQGFTRVTAPYDGWVLQTHAEAGDLAVPGKPLLTVYAPQPLRVVVQVPASRSSAVRSATQTQIQLDAGVDATSSAWVVPVARSAVPSADPVSQTTEWRLELSTGDAAKAVPGQQVRVQFTAVANALAVNATRLRIPAAAVLRRGELTAVYVVDKAGFALRAVRLGADFGADGVEVQAGLKAGEPVALDPVRAGMPGAHPAK